MRYRERSHTEWMHYCRTLREWIRRYGSGRLVYIDESGFEAVQTCLYAWAERGKKVYGERTGKRGKCENLVTARRKGKKDLIVPMIFSSCLNADGFEGGFECYLLPSLSEPSVLIMDNAPIHRQGKIKALAEAVSQTVLFLPKYSPDLNDIEHDFSALKQARMYAESGT